MATSTASSGVAMIALSQIRHDRNVRQQLAASEVDALAQSISLLGQLTPVSVRSDREGGYVLIAGHKRYAALAQLGHAEIRAEIRDDSVAEESERAAENIVRSQLNPYEEALAVKAMLSRGLSEAGAAQALGWSPQRVGARVKLLELPEAAQVMIGDGRIALSAVDQLRAIGTVSPGLLEALIVFLAEGNEWAADRLAREPGWVLDSALRSTDAAVFAEHLSTVNAHGLAALRLGKKTDALLAQATELHKKLDRYAYGPPTIRFAQEDIDQARAAGVIIEFERAAPIIVDRGVYRELCKAAIKRTVAQLEADVAAREQERKTSRQRGRAADPVAEAKRAERRDLRELAQQAHGVNLDVGAGLLTGLVDGGPDRPHGGAVLRLRPAGQRSRRLRLHGHRGAGGAAGRLRDPLGDRAVPPRRDQDPHGRDTRPDADRVQRPAQPRGPNQVAVAIHRRRQYRR